MSKTIQITPELARLRQQHVQKVQRAFLPELARCIAEQAVMEIDPACDFILESDLALSDSELLMHLLSVNDIVVNGRHIHIVHFDRETKSVSQPKILLESDYGRCGSLVVLSEDSISGSVIGYIARESWLKRGHSISESEYWQYSFETPTTFDLKDALEKIVKDFQPLKVGTASGIKAVDYIQFLRDRHSLSQEKQIEIIDACMHNASVVENLSAMSDFHPFDIGVVLHQSGVWESRIETLIERLHVEFPAVEKSSIGQEIRSLSEKHGGQPQAPLFKTQLLKSLARQQFKAQCKADLQEMSQLLIDQIFAGKAAVDAIKGAGSFIKSQIAVDAAALIRKKRQDLHNIAQATADEIGFAFQQLALQPAYATHSQEETSAVNEINQAIELLEIADKIEALKDIEI